MVLVGGFSSQYIFFQVTLQHTLIVTFIEIFTVAEHLSSIMYVAQGKSYHYGTIVIITRRLDE